MKYSIIKKLLILIFFSATFLLLAQEPVSIHISEKDGLPSKEFYNILEDDKGFIWLCADKGLFRYDGKVFKNYSNAKQRGLSVFNVQQDASKRIWCNNISGQFFYVKDNKLHLFVDLSKLLKGELAPFIVKDNYLWVFTMRKIYKINLSTKLVELGFNANYSIGNPLKVNKTIYFTDKNSLSSITSDNKLKNILALNLPIIDKNGKGVSQGKHHLFKVGTSLYLLEKRVGIKAFFQFNFSNNTITKLKGFDDLANERIYTNFANGNEIWFTTSSGVWIYEFDTNKFQLKNRFLKNTNVTKIIKDKENNYWLTTLNKGIYVIPNINIEVCKIAEENKNISSLDIVNDSTLVFGTRKGNVGFYNVFTNKEKHINLPTKDRVSVLKYHSKKNSVFISKDLHSYILNYKTLQFVKIEKFNTAKSLTLLKNNDLLLTSYSKVRIFKKGNLNNKVSISESKRTYASYYNEVKNETYVSYIDDLVKYDSAWNPKVIQYKNKPIHSRSITKTTNGIVWVSTFKNGVYGIKNDSVIHHYTTKNGLTSNNISKIKADYNKLWITLDNSIQLLDVATEQLKTLTKHDGIISYDISGIEILNNRVFFSSNEGLFSLDKENSFKTQHPEVYFNTIEINKKDTIIASKYKLKYNQNAIKIGFNVNGFLYNQKEKYKYRLKGFNDNWLTTDIGTNSVKYNSLPAGEYTFQVQPILGKKTNKSQIKRNSFFN